MIFRLEYCNKASVTARVDIQKGVATPVYTVEGTSEPFVLFYNNDNGDKSGSFRSSGADINIYETTEFNIDELKTSNETEISVKYYINNILNWSGFVIPDFFSETITGGQGVVSMVASDRLGTLKGATLSGLSAKVSNRSLAEACLAQTGLSLPLYTMADFTGDGTNIFNSEVLSQRMVDTKGRNVSCYDILSSILEETNSLIVQRNGAWYIINKLQLEAGSGSLYSAPATSSAWVENTVSFDDVSVGARRTITPVAATVGVYHEHGGGRMHPDNYDFSQGVTGWTPVGGFVASTDNRQVLNYTIGGTGGALYSPVYGEGTQANHLVNENAYVRNTNPIYLESAPIDIPYNGSGAIEVEIDVNGVGPAVYPNFAGAYLRVAVVAVSGTKVLTLAHGGQFVDMPAENPPIFEKEFDRSLVTTDIPAIAKGMKIKGTLEVADDLSTYDIKIRIYGGGSGRVILYNSVSVVMRNSLEIPKGNIFKTTQGANYTKDHEIPTVLWGDYLTSGLNGYFYDYPIDDTSSLYRPTGELHSKWTSYGDPDTLPLLQHITRQKARMFSVAHDLLSADIATSTFDALSIFVSCEGTSDETRYVVVSARFDFLRSNVSVELEEIAYVTNSKRDYIYSYFGDGEEGISSIGGISVGTTSTGGGLTSEQLAILNNLASWWKLDEVNDAIYSEKNVYSQQGVSAYGQGVDGGGSGVDLSKLLSWAGYTSEMADYYAPASLLVPFYNDMQTRVGAIENTDYAELDSSGKVLSSQLPSYVDDVMEFASFSALPVTGESGKIYITTDTNRQYRWSGTAYAEISSSLALGETSSTAYRGDLGKAAYDHSQSEHQAIINGTGFVKAIGKTLSYDNNSYSLSTHNHTGVYEPANANIQSHISSTSNPHSVTKAQVGLGNVDNTSDASKPISTATQTALNAKADTTSLTAHTSSTSNPHGVTKAQVGLGNVLNVASYSKTESDASLALKLNKSIFDDLFEKVEVSTGVYAIEAKFDFYSIGGVSAYGIGSGGSGGGIDLSKLLSWAGYTSEMADYYVPASMLVPFYNDYNGHGHVIGDVTGLQSALDGKVDDSQVLTNVPAGALFTDTIYTHPSHTARTSGLYKITVDSLGHVTGATAVIKADITALGIPAQDTVYTHPASHPISLIDGLQGALDGKASSTHDHSGVYEPKNVNIQEHIASIANPHGVTAAQVGLGSVLNVPSYSKTESDANYPTLTNYNAHVADAVKHITSAERTAWNAKADDADLTAHEADTVKHVTALERTAWNGAVTDQHTHANKTQIDGITALHLQVLSKLNVDASGNLYSTENFYSVGGVSAYGPGIGDDSAIQSAYDVWLSAGNTGTKDDFFAAIAAPAITAVQSYTEAEKLIARTNIGALSASAVNDVTNYNEITI